MKPKHRRVKSRSFGDIFTEATNAPAKETSSFFLVQDSIIGDLTEVGAVADIALQKLGIAEARLTVEADQFLVKSFSYHFPVAQQWARAILFDPKGVSEQLIAYITQWITLVSQQPTLLSNNISGNFLDAGLPYTFTDVPTKVKNLVFMQANMYSPTGPWTDPTYAALYKAAFNAAPYGNSADAQKYAGSFVTMDYVVFPFRLIVALCMTNTQAAANLASILFGPEMIACMESAKPIQDQWAAIIKSGFTPTVMARLAGMGYFSTQTQQQFLDNEARRAYQTFWDYFVQIFDVFGGPAYLLPYTSTPPKSPGYAVMLGFLKNNPDMINYLQSVSDVGIGAPCYTQFDEMFSASCTSGDKATQADYAAATPYQMIPLPEYSQAELAAQQEAIFQQEQLTLAAEKAAQAAELQTVQASQTIAGLEWHIALLVLSALIVISPAGWGHKK